MDVDDQTEWIEEERLPALAKVKILTLKLCRHRCLVHADSESALDIASPVLQLLFSILQNGGMLTEEAIEEYVVPQIFSSTTFCLLTWVHEVLG